MNSVHQDEDTDGVDSTEYYSEGNDDEETDTPQIVPPLHQNPEMERVPSMCL